MPVTSGMGGRDLNGIGHLAGSALTRSYSPGVVSGVGIWAPLGLFAVIRSRKLLPCPVWRRGSMAGALMLGGAALPALPLSHPAIPAYGQQARP